MWLAFALMSPLFWALVHVLDAHCVERVFDRPWMGVITSALASIVAFLLIPFVAPFVPWEATSWEIIVLALLAGTLIQFSQAFYFQSLSYSEPGIVAAYWNMIPTLLPLASFTLLGAVLQRWHYLGIALLVVTSVIFCMLDTNFEARWRSFFLMFVASCLQVSALMIEKYVFERSPFFTVFLLITTGIVISGSLPLLLRPVRIAFQKNMTALRPAVIMIVAIEVANLAALLMSQRAIDLGIPSLVAAVESTIPAYTFVFSMALVSLTKRFEYSSAWHLLPVKLLLVAVMALGIWLLAAP